MRETEYMTSADGGRTWEKPERLTLKSDGERWASAVAGTDACAIVLMDRSGGQIQYRRRDFTTGHGDSHHQDPHHH